MSEQIKTILKRKLDELSSPDEISAETRYNAFKEELQFYVLNFIYHHPEYSKWIMYGGSALRIIHDLDRMSVDLDFEISHEVTNDYLGGLGEEIKEHFANTYNAGDDFLKIKITNNRGLLLKFFIGDELSSGHLSKQLHVKIDLNHFVAPKTVAERRPINRGQLSFVILTYNMSSLMASKIAAIFLRDTRGVGEAVYEEKGRDIYDLLWYMGKKIVPDFDYLAAKGINVKNPRTLFDKLTLQMNKVNNNNLKNDLSPLFVNQTFIKNWLENWLESYFHLLDNYKLRTVSAFIGVEIHEYFQSDNYSFTYSYNTEEGRIVAIRYTISSYWVDYNEGNLLTKAGVSLNTKIKFTREGLSSSPMPEDKLRQYATLFYQKTENYFKKINKIMIGDSIATKIIRLTADNFNPKEQIILNMSALLSCELDDLLK